MNGLLVPILRTVFGAVCLCFVAVPQNFAQSGRILPAPAPTHEAKEKPETKDHPPCEEKFDQFIELHFMQVVDFFTLLNKYGECGYRLEKASRYVLDSDAGILQMKLVGLTKQYKGDKYEYAWFIARSPGEAQTFANNLAEKGFYFKESMSFVYGRCGTIAQKQKEENKGLGSLGDILNMGMGQIGSFFVFERKAGSFKKNEYRVLNARTTGKKGELEENKKIMDEYIAKGFRPVDLWYLGFTSLHFVVMEKDDSIKPQGDYIFVSQYTGLNKKLTESAKLGYRLILAGYSFAVLNRLSTDPLNIEYDSIETYGDIEKKLLKWKAKNLSYVTTGISDYFTECDPFDGKWFFSVSSQPMKNEAALKEYQFINRNNFIDEYMRKNNLNPTKKNPLTNEQLQEIDIQFNAEINRLVKEGYTIVNYGVPNSTTLMLERHGSGGGYSEPLNRSYQGTK
jgi:hypothetical protein